MYVLSLFDVLVPTFQKVAARTEVGDLDTQTPCEDWKVRDLFGHLIGGATTFAAVVRGDEPGEPVPVDDAAMSSAASAAIADLDAAFRSAGAMERTITTPFGDMPGETFARLLSFDLLMHTWDLATATGQPVSVPDDVVAEIDTFARAALRPELRTPGVFGPEVEAPAGADRLTRLVAFSGRRP